MGGKDYLKCVQNDRVSSVQIPVALRQSNLSSYRHGYGQRDGEGSGGGEGNDGGGGGGGGEAIEAGEGDIAGPRLESKPSYQSKRYAAGPKWLIGIYHTGDTRNPSLYRRGWTHPPFLSLFVYYHPGSVFHTVAPGDTPRSTPKRRPQ